MNGRDTIIIMLKCYFRAPEYKVIRFNRVCNLLLSGVVHDGYERTPAFEDLEAEIDSLALTFLPDMQYDLGTIQDDLWTMLVNWWDAVKWARQGGRRQAEASMETEDLFADLVDHIVQDIRAGGNRNMAYLRQYYRPNILEALIQMSTPPFYITDPFLQQALPLNVNLIRLRRDYQRLSNRYGFGIDVHILLQLLYDKMNRNSRRHAYFLLRDYRQYCRDNQRQQSFNDYIVFRGLNIPQHLLLHCQRLFREQYGL
jgi:hypothetical protein